MAANIDPNSAVYATDEYGRPFIIVREGQQKSRLSGIAAIRVSFFFFFFNQDDDDVLMDFFIYIFSLISLLPRLYLILLRLLLVLVVSSYIYKVMRVFSFLFIY